jgi:hypothetical protein
MKTINSSLRKLATDDNEQGKQPKVTLQAKKYPVDGNTHREWTGL